jgi:hypothetical protein
MANLIHMYKGTITSGGTDGTLISEGDGSNPITVGPLNATINEESAPIKLALRCDTGFTTVGNVVITPQGTNMDKWALALDNAGAAGTFGAYGASLTITDTISTTNKIFWARAKAVSTEDPVNDTTVDLTVQATIAAV